MHLNVLQQNNFVGINKLRENWFMHILCFCVALVSLKSLSLHYFELSIACIDTACSDYQADQLSEIVDYIVVKLCSVLGNTRFCIVCAFTNI